MVELRAYFDFILRKFHVFFYRLHLNILRYDSIKLSIFFSFVFHRTIWNWNNTISKVAQFLSRNIGGDILSLDEWIIIIQTLIYGIVVILLIKYWKLIWRFIIWIILIITFPIRFIVRGIIRR